MNPTSYEYKHKSALPLWYLRIPASRGVQFGQIEMPTVCWKTRLTNSTKMLSIRKSSILRISPSFYVLEQAVCPLTKLDIFYIKPRTWSRKLYIVTIYKCKNIYILDFCFVFNKTLLYQFFRRSLECEFRIVV